MFYSTTHATRGWRRRAALAVCLSVSGGLVAATAADAAILDTEATKAPARAFQAPAADAAAGGDAKVIVGLKARFETKAALSDPAAVRLQIKSARGALYAALQGTSYSVTREYGLLPYVALSLSPQALQKLQASGAAASVHTPKMFEPLGHYQPELMEAVPQQDRGFAGAGQVAAILDSGFETAHPYLAGKDVDPACFGSRTRCPNGETSQYGTAAVNNGKYHGTTVAGIALGSRFGSIDYDGMAPSAKYMPVVIRGGTGATPEGVRATEEDLLAGFDYVMARRAAGVNVTVINASIGLGSNPAYLSATDCSRDISNQREAVATAVQMLRDSGVPTIVAAGNEYSTTSLNFPACLEEVITVGATTEPDAAGVEQVASFSNSSPRIELLAPGERLKAPYQDGEMFPVLQSGNPRYARGTSFAAPAVAGAWLQYLSRFPGSSVDEVLAALQATGKPITDTRNNVTKSRVNIAAAMRRWGFVVATLPTAASYTPSASQQANSTGASNQVVRSSTGVYSVRMPKLGNAWFGHAQAQAIGSGTARCKIASPSALDGSTAMFAVRCFTPAGAPVDAPFVAQFEVDEARTGTKRGYLYALAADGEPIEPSLMSSPTNSAYSVQTLGTGRYVASLSDFTNSDGVPQVTAHGTAAVHCRATGWSDDAVSISCFNAAGAYANTAFSLAFRADSSFTGRRSAYVYADQMTATTAYTPGAGKTWNSQGAVNTARKTATGKYDVILGGLPATNVAPFVTAVSSTGTLVLCRVESWTASGSNALAKVGCSNAAGAATDSRFALTYSTSVS